MTTKRYYTVVYEITNEEAFKRVAGQATASMADDVSPIDGVTVTACGEGDTMTGFDALCALALDLGHNPDTIIREYCEDNELDADAILG